MEFDACFLNSSFKDEPIDGAVIEPATTDSTVLTLNRISL